MSSEPDYPDINLSEDEGKPQPSFSREIIYINLPLETQRKLPKVRDNPIRVVIGIDAYGMISLEMGTSWYGRKYKGAMGHNDLYDPRVMQPDDHMAAYNWLIEWELAEWRSIGPEDKELYATKKFAEDLRTTTEMHW